MKRAGLIFALLLTSCRSAPITPSSSSGPVVSVLTFNIENLFDVEDDPERDDETFLPIDQKSDLMHQNKCRISSTDPSHVRQCLRTDWSEAKLQRKIDRLSDVVAQVNDGRGPDILILQEVESLEVLEQWNRTGLRDMGYQTIQYVKGPDQRGINCAILSRLPALTSPKLHLIDLSDLPNYRKLPTRGILESHLRLSNGDAIAVFAVHFPSQGAPTVYRQRAIDRLLEVTAQIPQGAPIVVGGDFNISSKEELNHRLLREKVAPRFAISHLIGCSDCIGTVYYPKDQTWSFFDVLLFSPDLVKHSAGWRVRRDSIRVINSSVYQTNRFGGPARFGSGRGPVGVSDHWPVYAELELKESP